MQSNNTDFLFIHNISKKIKKCNNISLLRNINLSFPNKGMYFLTGKNGSGKSTLLSIIGGLNKPSNGEIYFCGKSIYNQKRSYLESYRNEITGFIFQDNNLIEKKSVYDNLALSYQLKNKKVNSNEIIKKLTEVNILNVRTFLNKKVSSLSGGEKQKVCIVRALIKNVKILIADEPSSSLDLESEKEIYNILKSISSKILVIAVSHDKKIVNTYSEGTIELENGTCKKNDLQRVSGDFEKCIVPKNSHLSFTEAFKFALDFILTKKIKLVVSIVITLITISLLGFSITTLNANPTKTLISMLYDNNITDIILNNDNKLKIGYYPESNFSNDFSIEQKSTIKKFTKQDELINVYMGTKLQQNIDGNFKEIDIINYEKNLTFDINSVYNNVLTPYSINYKGYLNGIIEMNENDLDYAGFGLDSELQDPGNCHFPKNNTEIALTSFKAKMYLEYGFRNNDNQIIQINSLDDLIGKKLDKYTITAIYETEENENFSLEHSLTNVTNQKKIDENNAYLEGTYINNYAIMAKGTVADFCKENDVPYDYNIGVFFKAPKSPLELHSLLVNLSYKTETDYGGTIYYKAKIESPVTSVVSNVYNQMYSVTHIGSLVSTGIFFFLDLFVLSFLVSTSFNEKKKTLSVLVSLGARRKDIASICLLETFVICLTNLLLSSIIIANVCNYLNKIFYCNFFVYDFVAFLLLTIVVSGIFIIATWLPLFKLLVKQPIDLVKEKNE